jgi:hypothetical protein
MNTETIRILTGVFLIAHAWIHIGLAQVPVPQPGGLRTPFLPAWWRDAVDPNWPVSRLGLSPQITRTLGWILWILVAAGYIAAGIMLLFIPSQVAVWQGLTVGASGLSLLLLILYWHPWYPVGALIDLALLAGVILQYPAALFGS